MYIPIQYVVGDATQPQGEGNKVILHCCNDEGKWGAGFSGAVSKRWPEPERVYRDCFAKHYWDRLGEIQIVNVAPDIVVINAIMQHGIQQPGDMRTPFQYSSCIQALEKVADFCRWNKVTVHCPKFGSGLAKGDWTMIATYVTEILSYREIPVIVYTLE